MKRLWPAVLLLTGCAGAASKPQAPGFTSVSKSFHCPNPLTQSYTVVRSNGAASMTIWQGPFPSGEIPRASMRHHKRLSPAEVTELAAFLRRSGYEKLPDKWEPWPPGQAVCMDCCDGSLEIDAEQGKKSLSWRGHEPRPPGLEAVLAGIDAVLERSDWLPGSGWNLPEN